MPDVPSFDLHSREAEGGGAGRQRLQDRDLRLLLRPGVDGGAALQRNGRRADVDAGLAAFAVTRLDQHSAAAGDLVVRTRLN